MTENERARLAAELLVDRGLLARETDDRLVDLTLDGRGFRYLTSFWERVGALARDAGGSWRSPLDGAPDMSETQLRVAVEWAAVGAPLEWARGQAGAALDAFLRRFAGGTWSEARPPSPDAERSVGVRAEGEGPLPVRRTVSS